MRRTASIRPESFEAIGRELPLFQRRRHPTKRCGAVCRAHHRCGGRKPVDYRITITDPATFTEPMVLEKFWVWLSDVRVERYDCTVGD